MRTVYLGSELELHAATKIDWCGTAHLSHSPCAAALSVSFTLSP